MTTSTVVADHTLDAIRVDHITCRAGTTTTLRPTSLSIAAGQIVGIAGGSGAGKTTLLEIIAGVRAPTAGQVIRTAPSAFVPQDDIIHREMPLRRTLVHAAALRLADLNRDERARAVDRVLERLDLTERADVRVGKLSGGQRKRASLAAEMLTDPELFFLDEPTSGLDPASAADLLRSLRALTESGSTVVLSTHSPADLARCDRVVFMARGGHVAFVGSPAEAKAFFCVDDLADAYEQLNDWPFDVATSDDATSDVDDAGADPTTSIDQAPMEDWTVGAPSAGRQWSGLVRRNIDLINSNRLTLAIIAGSPVFIIGMMTFLFPSGVFDTGTGNVALAIQTLFWMAFNSFFFGLTYGLLQVVGEFDVVHRERRVGLRMGAYIASKLTVLVPMLAVVNVMQLAVMETAGRLPDMTAVDRMAMFVSLQLLSTAAVAIGLHASSAVHNSSQATLALPMLCFPQVLFAGAVVPVSAMGTFAEVMSAPLAVRWGFEPLGRILDLGPVAASESGTSGFADTFTGSAAVGWSVLAGLSVVSVVAAVRTLNRRTSASVG